MAQTGRSHMNVLFRRSLPALALAGGVWALASAVFTVDATEYGLVTRFGRVVRVVTAPGLYIAAPFDRVVRLDKRILFSRAASSEYLTIDKKNVVVESLATWRIADPERFLGTFPAQAAAEQPSVISFSRRSVPFSGNFRPPLLSPPIRRRAVTGRSSPRSGVVSRISPDPPMASRSSALISAVCRYRSKTGRTSSTA